MIVLGASALVDVVLDQPNRDELLEHFDQPLTAPAHQSAEVLSAIARLRRAGVLDSAAASDAMRAAAALVQDLVVPDARLLARTLALDGRIRVLDGLYIALAECLGCAVLTSDRRLAEADPPCEIVLVPASGR